MLPLDKIHVIDCTQNVAGPYAAMILAELGADVIRVESPVGDATRTWGPPFWNGNSPTYMALNRNKIKLTIDLKTGNGMEKILELLEKADVFMVSSRPGSMKKLGLDSDTLLVKFPKLIYAELTAFGIRGPRANDPGYDPLMQAMGGIMSVTGLPDLEPIRVGVSIVDKSTGLWTALGVLSALRLREQTGHGHKINTSLYETAISWMDIHFGIYWASGVPPEGFGSGASMIAPYEAFPSSDGWIVIAAGNDKLFQKLGNALNHSEWAEDPRFRTNPDRVQNRVELKRIISEITKKKTNNEIEGLLKKLDIPSAPVLNLSQVNEEPQLRELGIVQSVDHPMIPNFQSIGLPLSIDNERPPLRIPPPT
jgi:crotonobetainyl-CoA:carnitine CoA-transferase CaiB-like acyl-CoA transferase